VTAVNAAGSGAVSAKAAVTPRTIPAPPTGLVATPEYGKASVAFTAPSDDGGSAVTNLEYSIDDGRSWTARSPAAVTSPLRVTGLVNGKESQVRLRAVNAAGPGAASTPVSVTAGWREVCGDIGSDTLWSPDVAPVYLLSCPVRVKPGATLSVASGTVMKVGWEGPDRLQVDGALVVQGTADTPVVFTSARDDSVGGDTNGDGSATAPGAGDWGGIAVSSSGSLTLRHARVRFGNTVSANGVDGLVVTDSVFSDNSNTGLEVSGGTVAEVRRNVFTRNGLRGAEVDCSTSPHTWTWGRGAALVFNGVANALDLALIAGNTGSGNGQDLVELNGLTVSGTWPTTGLPMVPGYFGEGAPC